MSRRPRSHRRPLAFPALIAACCATAVTLGCGAGQITQTDSQVAAVDGASGDIGTGIALRDVLIPLPANSSGTYLAGSDVPVLLTIVNQGTSADELISVRSPAASRVLVLGTSTIPAGTNVTSTVPAGSRPLSPLVVGELRIVLTTTQPLRAGRNTPITFVFRNAGEVTVPVPMAAPPSSVSEIAGSHHEAPDSHEESPGGHG
ncbi:MAG: copper chaperone PCu(A)C [Pseudonocardiaceae bacterium]